MEEKNQPSVETISSDAEGSDSDDSGEEEEEEAEESEEYVASGGEEEESEEDTKSDPPTDHEDEVSEAQDSSADEQSDVEEEEEDDDPETSTKTIVKKAVPKKTKPKQKSKPTPVPVIAKPVAMSKPTVCVNAKQCGLSDTWSTVIEEKLVKDGSKVTAKHEYHLTSWPPVLHYLPAPGRIETKGKTPDQIEDQKVRKAEFENALTESMFASFECYMPNGHRLYKMKMFDTDGSLRDWTLPLAKKVASPALIKLAKENKNLVECTNLNVPLLPVNKEGNRPVRFKQLLPSILYEHLTKDKSRVKKEPTVPDSPALTSTPAPTEVKSPKDLAKEEATMRVMQCSIMFDAVKQFSGNASVEQSMSDIYCQWRSKVTGVACELGPLNDRDVLMLMFGQIMVDPLAGQCHYKAVYANEKWRNHLLKLHYKGTTYSSPFVDFKALNPITKTQPKKVAPPTYMETDDNAKEEKEKPKKKKRSEKKDKPSVKKQKKEEEQDTPAPTTTPPPQKKKPAAKKPPPAIKIVKKKPTSLTSSVSTLAVSDFDPESLVE